MATSSRTRSRVTSAGRQANSEAADVIRAAHPLNVRGSKVSSGQASEAAGARAPDFPAVRQATRAAVRRTGARPASSAPRRPAVGEQRLGHEGGVADW